MPKESHFSLDYGCTAKLDLIPNFSPCNLTDRLFKRMYLLSSELHISTAFFEN